MPLRLSVVIPNDTLAGGKTHGIAALTFFFSSFFFPLRLASSELLCPSDQWERKEWERGRCGSEVVSTRNPRTNVETDKGIVAQQGTTAWALEWCSSLVQCREMAIWLLHRPCLGTD